MTVLIMVNLATKIDHLHLIMMMALKKVRRKRTTQRPKKMRSKKVTTPPKMMMLTMVFKSKRLKRPRNKRCRSVHQRRGSLRVTAKKVLSLLRSHRKRNLKRGRRDPGMSLTLKGLSQKKMHLKGGRPKSQMRMPAQGHFCRYLLVLSMKLITLSTIQLLSTMFSQTSA
jgi:hypothetical protein